jgi:hypothetical protein
LLCYFESNMHFKIFCSNSNPEAINYCKKYYKYHITSTEYIRFSMYMYHPYIFELNYAKMKETHQELCHEIIMKAWSPERVAKLCELYENVDEL